MRDGKLKSKWLRFKKKWREFKENFKAVLLLCPRGTDATIYCFG